MKKDHFVLGVRLAIIIVLIVSLCTLVSACDLFGPSGPTEDDIEIITEYYNYVADAVYVKVKNNYSESCNISFKITEYFNDSAVDSHVSNLITVPSGETALLRAYLLKGDPTVDGYSYKITGWNIRVTN